jgi:polysaccharide export outer membrane protein
LVVEPGGRVDDFFEIMLGGPLGAVRDGTVTDDGYLRLPLIPPIQAADHYFSDVSERISVAYAEVFPELEVTTVFALRRRQRKITVLGEVFNGGTFDAVRPVSVLEAIALAGGFTDRARRGQVLLFHPDYRERTLTVRVLDMTKGLKMDDPSIVAWTVRPHDIVYVPRSTISDLNVFVDQFVTQMIPFDLRINILAGSQPE